MRRAALLFVAAMTAWSCRRAVEPAVPSPTATPVVAASPLVVDTAGVVARIEERVRGKRRVSLSGMGLTAFPVSAIAVLGTVEELDLSRNALESLPEALGEIPGLVALDVSNNRLSAVPALPKLRFLNVKGNPVAAIPPMPALETLYVDTIGDVEALLAMTNLRAVGVDWRVVHAESGYQDVSIAHAWGGSVRIAADLPGAASGGGADVFIAPPAAELRLASDEARGGPCTGLTLGTMRGLEESAMRAKVAGACAPLHIWSQDGPAPLSLGKLRVAPTATDACDESRRAFELFARIRPGGWFVTSAGAPPRKPTVPAAKMARVSEGMTLTLGTGMTLPPGFSASGTRWFVHPEGGAQLALVRARGFGGDEMPLRRMEWRGLFLVTKTGVTRLAESDPYAACAGPHLFDLAGVADVGGDGDLDIVLIGEEPMLLERIEGGFQSHAPMRVPCTC